MPWPAVPRLLASSDSPLFSPASARCILISYRGIFATAESEKCVAPGKEGVGVVFCCVIDFKLTTLHLPSVPATARARPLAVHEPSRKRAG
jgi:hypothetical protein